MSKTRIILEYLQEGNTITDMKAVELCNSYRLSSIIYQLRSQGHNIQDRWLENTNKKYKYKEYWLVKESEKEETT